MQLLGAANDASCEFSELGSYVSEDGGTTWTTVCTQLADSNDPALAYGYGTAYVATAYGGDPGYVEAQTSQDGGLTWSSRVTVARSLLGGDVNLAWAEVDNNASSPYENSVYLSVTQFDTKVVDSEISVSHSSDNGNTWTTTTVDPVQIKPVVDQFSRLTIGSDGTVFVAWQRCVMTGSNINCAGTKAEMLLAKSSDGGNTWSTPVTIATVNLVPDTCDCAFFGNLPLTYEQVANMPVIGIDNSSGAHARNLYAVLYNWTGTQMKVEVATSSNGGSTWGKPLPVAPAARHDEFFPTLSVSPSGAVGVSWLDRRNDPRNIKYQPYAAESTDGGATFSKSYPVTSYLSDPYLDGNGGTYMGDYTGNAWNGDGTFLVTWPDTRNLQFMQDYIGGFEVE